MDDKTYAEFHRDMMALHLDKQDAEWNKKSPRADYYFLRFVSTLIVLSGLLSFYTALRIALQ